MKMDEFDIAILGGGLAGLCLARSLAAHHLNIALIERHERLPFKALDQDRLSQARALALSRHSVEYLQHLKIWDKVNSSAQAIETVHVSAQGKLGKTVIRAADYHLNVLGYVINAELLTDALWQSVAECSDQIKIFCPAEIEDLKRCGLASAESKTQFTAWEIKLSNNTTLRCKLLAAADGIDSFARKSLGIEAFIHDHQETALISNIQLADGKTHHQVAYERFLDHGSIALLPITKDHMKCVWILQNTEANFWKLSTDENYLAKVQALFGDRLGRFKSCSSRVAIPLRSMTTESLYTQRFCLIGNAANTLHPIAAQGFNIACRDIMQLTHLLALAKQNKEDIGSLTLLQNYSEMRRLDHENTRYFTQTLAHHSKNRLLPLGLLAAEFISQLKSTIAGLGIQGRPSKIIDIMRIQDHLNLNTFN